MIQQQQAPALGLGNGGQVPPSPAHTPAGRTRASGQAESGGPSRNAPCYCGSGKKYKRCHGAPGGA
ncbi:SEC-C metal-binding domain-containing protein [Paractinoplanes tereljensis]|uniref:SEC-C metal-binding domain-containing protein n=1 Tax=Paractinoplanes tereljensis TaxID=571912 RepID=UPI003F6928C8